MMLGVIMLIDMILNVIKLSVVKANVVAASENDTKIKEEHLNEKKSVFANENFETKVGVNVEWEKMDDKKSKKWGRHLFCKTF